MMKNKNTIARLLAEEDIHVVNKAMDTAYFNIKKRELGLPIWKDEISKDEEELMVCHEIGHALWTSMDMLDKSRERKLNHSFVNIIEDARIEKFVQNKYPGSINLFKKGYKALAARDFFGIADEDVNAQNLIDRINLYFKMMPGVKFSEKENVFVNRAKSLETEDEVLDLAEDLYAFMKAEMNEEENKEAKTDGNDSGEEGENGNNTSGDGNSNDDNGNDSNDGNEAGSDKSDEVNDGQDIRNTDGNSNNSSGSADPTGPISEERIGSEVGSDGSGSGTAVPEAKTDTALTDALKTLADDTAFEKTYARIPKLKSEDYIVDYKTIIEDLENHYESDMWFNTSLDEIKEFKTESKKTVSYMVKEFEMKKSADQYARASTAKTGSLDMGALHTYKFNDDLFKKVTTLPGATNHGMIIMLDWSGSMQDNLKGTVEQLLQLVMFCRRTKIPFEVFAFTSAFNGRSISNKMDSLDVMEYGDIMIDRDVKLLNFFSSKMSAAEEEKSMHYIWMLAKYMSQTYENWSVSGYPQNPPGNYYLGGTPLNDSIIMMMDFLPKYKKSTGVQKLNTIFLTDGASNNLYGVKDYREAGQTYTASDIVSPFDKENLLIDPVNNKQYDFRRNNITQVLLSALKKRVPDMNLVGFFLAGSGRKGIVSRNTWSYILAKAESTGNNMPLETAMSKMRKDKVVALDSVGYDQYFILPGGDALNVENTGLSDDLVGASKGKLKTAFAKSNKGRIQSRVLLNKFVAMVA